MAEFLANNLQDLILKITELPNYGTVFKIKIFFIIVSILFIGLIIYFLLTTKWLKFFLLYDLEEIMTFKPAGTSKSGKDWEKIIKRLDSDLESEYKLTIIDADNLLNSCLQNLGYGGATLEDKLAKINAVILPNVAAVKETRVIRNKIVHDPDFKISKDDAKKVLAVYEKSLSDLHMI